LRIAGIPIPSVCVTAEDVERGKPFPDPYLLGAKLCGVEPTSCLVVEDTPAGIASGRAAGCKTLGVVTSHTRDAMEKANPDYLVTNLTSVSVKLCPDGIEVVINIEKE